MSEPAETRNCPRCAETIKAAAKICPYCGLMQQFHALWRSWLPLTFSLFLLLSPLAVALLVMPDTSSEGRTFVAHRSNLVVVKPSVQRSAGPEFYLTGVVTNTGTHPWRVRGFEVRFLDQNSRLLDVRQVRAPDSFVVLPGQDHGFSAKMSEVPFATDNISHEVRVASAMDGERPPKDKP